MYQRVHAAAKDPRTVCPELPEYIANVILKCLEKDAAKRYQSAREILTDLETQSAPAVSAPAAGAGSAAAGTRTISIQVPRPARPAWWIAAGGLAVVAALALAIPGIRHRILPARGGAGNGGQAAIQHYVAVLPFRIAGDQENAKYIADGVVDSLVGQAFRIAERLRRAGECGECSGKTAGFAEAGARVGREAAAAGNSDDGGERCGGDHGHDGRYRQQESESAASGLHGRAERSAHARRSDFQQGGGLAGDQADQ